jgi:hypothetical protein
LTPLIYSHGCDHGKEECKYEGVEKNNVSHGRTRTKSGDSPSDPEEYGPDDEFLIERSFLLPGEVPGFFLFFRSMCPITETIIAPIMTKRRVGSQDPVKSKNPMARAGESISETASPNPKRIPLASPTME